MNPNFKLRRVRPSLLLLGLALCVSLVACAQATFAQATGSATLRGTVKDPAGAVVPNASVTLVNQGTKEERKATTNDEGGYVFSAVTPGTYTVRVEAGGFKTTEQSDLSIETSSTRGLDINLEVGQASETVTVTAEQNQLQTETGSRENTITASQIENLSIISRSSLELLRILPGVVAPDNTALESIGFGDGANANARYNVNGMRGEQNNVSIDGARMIDIGSNNGTTITANPDMVQEVRIQTSNYAAEHGSSAVQISATTKSGTSDFHGSIYDYIRHHRFQANDRSNTINGIPRPKSKYNYPGGNLGGPITLPRFGEGGPHWWQRKDKAFFFVGYERYYQQVDEGSSLSRVPTLRERQGDFGEAVAAGQNITVPAGCTANGVAGNNGNNNDTAPNGDLRPCANPFGQALLNLFPLPNRAAAYGGNNYVYSVLRPNNRNQFTSRFDFNISENTRLYVRAAREYEKQGFPRGLWWNSSSYELPGKLQSSNLGRSLVVNLTNVVNPTMTNEILFSASKLKLNYDFAEPEKVTWEGLGLQPVGFFANPNNASIPARLRNTNPYVPLSVITWGQGDFHTAYGYPILAWNDSFALTDNLVKVHGTHTMKFGAFIEQANKRQQSNSDTNIETAQWGQTTGTLNNYGDIFVGKPIQFAQGSDRPIDNFRYYNYEFYAQDSWKLRPNMTLEYGLRFAYLPQNFERKGLGVLFDPSTFVPNGGVFLNGDITRPNGFRLASRGEIPKGVLPNLGIQWMPRLNFAWDVGGKGDLVVRAGAGLFKNRVQGNYDYYSSGELPNTYRATVGTPWGGPNNNGLTFGDLSNINPFTTISNIDINSRDIESNEIPTVANMSLTVEKRLPLDNILAVAYVGTQGRHLPQRRNANVIPLGALSSGSIPLATPVCVSAGGSGSAAQNGTCPGGGTLYTSLNLSNPAQRAVLADPILQRFRPFNAYRSVGLYQFTGTSTYHSLQATLSHQGRRLQYFATYTFGKALGTVATAESDGAAWADPIDTRNRSWGVLPFDRTHVFNLSYNYSVPDLAPSGFDNPFSRGVLNGWQISGITTVQSGIPVRLRFTGAIASADTAQAWYGSDAFNGTNAGASLGAVTPVYLRNPQRGGTALGSFAYDLSALAIPTFPNTGPSQPPFYIRTPGRSNFDVSFFKNFHIDETKKIQFRTGFFNVFNQAYPSQINVTTTNPALTDIFLALDTECVPGGTLTPAQALPTGDGTNVATVCDPTKGYQFTQNTRDNFGKILNKRGRRIVEFALKFEF
ncbi:MAG TPA: carboxypeptidase regulatory-like domain-containing protein [Pyrinomonadaceae bacterium]|nr:carboxypeptidase regulatory-like domain-containing protein [Pyrinomonadaceae bacterium]